MIGRQRDVLGQKALVGLRRRALLGDRRRRNLGQPQALVAQRGQQRRGEPLLDHKPDTVAVTKLIKQVDSDNGQAFRNQLARLTTAGEIANPSKGVYSVP